MTTSWTEPVSQDLRTQAQVAAIMLLHGSPAQQLEVAEKFGLTPKQEVRRERLERVAHIDIPQLKTSAEQLGLPTRFLKLLDEMKTYVEQQNEQLGR